jgi:hypothetical protein
MNGEGGCQNCRLEALEDEACPLCQGTLRFGSVRDLELALRAWAARELGASPSEIAFLEFVGGTFALANVGALSGCG